MATDTDTTPDGGSDLASGDPGQVLAVVREERRLADAAEARLMQAVITWAGLHGGDALIPRPGVEGAEQVIDVAEGCPDISEFAIYELAATLSMSAESGKTFLITTLELCYRLPKPVGPGDGR